MRNGDLAWVSIILAIVFHLVLFCATIWDFWVGTKYGFQFTISSLVLKWSQSWPIIPLLVGIVLGHLFWPQMTTGELREEGKTREAEARDGVKATP